MNKILSLFLSLIFVLSMPVISVYASDSVSVVIDNPADGSVIQNTELEVELTTTGTVTQTVLELDGTNISDFVLTASMLTIGEHTLVAYAIAEDGSVESDVSKFTVIKSISTSKLDCDFSNIDTSEKNLTGSTVQLGTGVTSIPQVAKNWKGIVSIIDGPGGEGDTAVNLTSSTSFSSSRPFYRFMSQGAAISTTAVIDFDINVNPGTNVLLSYVVPETVASNKTGYLKSNSDYLFDKSGKILGTSETYTANKWYNVRLVIYLANDEADLYVSHYDEEIGENVSVQILDRASINPTGGTLSDIRINYHGNANCGFGIDNVSITEEAVFTGISNVGYMYDTEETSDIYPDSSKLTAIKAYMNESVSAADFAGKVELISADGTPVSLSSVSYLPDDNALIITPSAKLDVNKSYKISTHLSVNYSGELAETDKASFVFKTAADSYALSSVDLKVGTTKLITSAQLKSKKLTADAHFSNSDTGEQNISLVLAVRSKGKLVGLRIVNATVPAQTSDYVVPLQTDTIPDDIEEVKIQVMLLESMTNRKPVFSTYEVNY